MAGRKASGRRAIAVFVASVGLHAAVAVMLGYVLARTPEYAEPRAVQVTLVAPPRPDTPPPKPRAEARPRTLRAAGAAAEVTPRPVAPAPAEARPAVDGWDERGLAVLQSLGGCNRPGLSREDRVRCETRAWARMDSGPSRLNLDVADRYAENPEPFLSRRPTRGCRVRATGDASAMGDSGHARAGVTCIIPF